MKQIFLTSSSDLVMRDVVKQIDLSRGKKLAFIYTAAEAEPGGRLSSWLDEDRKSLVTTGFDVFDYTLTGKTTKQLEHDLDKADVLFLSGGNTFYLLEQAQASGFTEVVKRFVEKDHKIYIGSSAGSVIAGPDIGPIHGLDHAEKAPNLKNYRGFYLVNFCVMPHWGSTDFRQLYLNHQSLSLSGRSGAINFIDRPSVCSCQR